MMAGEPNRKRRPLVGSGFVGRERELGELARSLERVCGGEGQFVLITGEAGIGKTRLVREWRESLRIPNAIFVSGKCSEAELESPYKVMNGVFSELAGVVLNFPERQKEPIVAALREACGDGEGRLVEVFPGLRGLLGDAQPSGGAPIGKRKAEFFRATLNVLTVVSETGYPLILFFDDLQYAKQETLELIFYLSGKIAASPVLLVGTYQSESIEGDNLFIGELAKLDEEMSRLDVLDLEPLGPEAVERIVGDMLGEKEGRLAPFCRRMVDMSRGNPLFVIEMTESLIDEGVVFTEAGKWEVNYGLLKKFAIPATVADVILRRAMRLTAAQLRVLGNASVIGREFDLDTLTKVSGEEYDTVAGAVDTAIGLQLIRTHENSEGGRKHYFIHDKIREHFCGVLEPGVKRQIHQAIGEILEKSHREDIRASTYELAYHFSRGEDWEKAARYCSRAGDIAGREYALREAISYYRRALEFSSGLSPEREVVDTLSTKEKLGDLYAIVGEHKKAIETFKQLLGQVEGDCATANTESKIGSVLFRMGDEKGSRQYHTDALKRIGITLPRTGIGLLWSIFIEILKRLWYISVTSRIHTRERDRRDEKIRLLITFYSQLAHVYYFINHRRALLVQLRQLNLAEKFGTPRELAQAYAAHGLASMQLCLFKRALRYISKSRDMSERLKNPWGIAFSENCLGICLFNAGNRQEAIEHCQRSIRIYSDIEDTLELGFPYATLGWVYCHNGDFEKAAAAFQNLHDLSERVGNMRGLVYSYNGLAEVSLARGDCDRAESYITDSIKLCEGRELLISLAGAYTTYGRILNKRGEPEKAISYFERSITIFKDNELNAHFEPLCNTGIADACVEASKRGWKTPLLRRSLKNAIKRLKTADRKSRNYAGLALRSLGNYYLELGKINKAERYYVESLNALRLSGGRYELAFTLLNYGRMKLDRGFRKGWDYLSEAEEIFMEVGARADLERVRYYVEQGHVQALLAAREGEDISPSALIKLSKVIDSALGSGEILEKLIAGIVDMMRAERGLLMLVEEGGLVARAAWNIDGANIDDPSYDFVRSVVSQVEKSGTPVIIGRGIVNYSGHYLDKFSGSLICVPLEFKGVFGGVLYIDITSGSNQYSSRDLELVAAVTAQIAVIVENLSLYKKVAELEKSRKESAVYPAPVIRKGYKYENIIAKSAVMQKVFRQLDKVIPTSATVLIEGDTGVGKELVAGALHYKGPRRNNAFVIQNCAALPESLLESELFGYKRGAFTGATADKKGLFEVADEGTIFLDEVAETSPSTQVKLLRVLDAGYIRRLGDTKDIKVNVRIISATNRNLKEEVAKGNFREDLYYRINVFPIKLPPLRDRREDIPLIASHFLQTYTSKLGKPIKGFSERAMGLLINYGYPGNVRELENIIHRVVTLVEDQEIITAAMLPEEVAGKGVEEVYREEKAEKPLQKVLIDAEREAIIRALELYNGHKAKAAKHLGISRQWLHRKVKKLGISPSG